MNLSKALNSSNGLLPTVWRRLFVYGGIFLFIMAIKRLPTRLYYFMQLGQTDTMVQLVVVSVSAAILLVAGLRVTSLTSLKLPAWLLLGLVGLLTSMIVAAVDYFALTQYLGFTSTYQLANPNAISPHLQFWVTFFYVLGDSGIILMLYYHREIHLRGQQILKQAEARRAEAAKKALQARLQVMQAQVEPEFLLGALKQVEALYGTHAQRADEMLDELIDYLRAAIPLMRTSASTYGQEQRLVTAYLQLRKSLDRPAIFINFPLWPEGEALPFPPMILLPLVAKHCSSATRIAVSHQRTNSKLTLSVYIDSLLPMDAEQHESMAQLTQRVKGLYGDDAALAAHENERGELQVRIEVPFSVAFEVMH